MYKQIFALLFINLILSSAYGQETALKDIIENTDLCDLENAILGKKIVVLNPARYSDNRLQKFTAPTNYFLDKNKENPDAYDTLTFDILSETDENGYYEYIGNGIYTITGLRQLTTSDLIRTKILIQFDCNFNDDGKFVQLNDSIYTYLNHLKWNELESYMLFSHFQNLSNVMLGKSISVNSKNYKIEKLIPGSEGIFVVCNDEKFKLSSQELEKCISGDYLLTVKTAIYNKKRIDNLIDNFEKHAAEYAEVHLAFNRGQKDAVTFQKFENEKKLAHEANDRIKESLRKESDLWTFEQKEHYLNIGDNFDLARLGLSLGLE